MDEQEFVLPLAAAPVMVSTLPTAPSGPPDRVAMMPKSWPDIEAPALPPLASDVGILSLERDPAQQSTLELDSLLLRLLEAEGSDLHLSMNAPPMVRIKGELQPLPGYQALTARAIRESVYSILTDRQKQVFEENKELDLAYELPGAARFRINLLQQQGSMGAVIRSIPWEIRSLEALAMPARVAELTELPRGLVLITGPTGSGKTTTLAALIDRVNRTRKGHIVTIEDPIEFVHAHKQCVVNQREVGTDTWSFANALKHALRQDPD
ncbi:MAG: ATPase, T2SS/T4P/T4SS family, partial [Actinomycetota bacterium]|nr:ATPase, T2SS/T4P/T4SS family [Actinomycetota bacterium]